MSSLTSEQIEAKKQHQSSKAKFKKAPQAPRRFKSAYIFYSTWKHKDIREQLSKRHNRIQTPEVAKMVSESWKMLSPEERTPWYEMARRDKVRFQLEKSMYYGPWKVLDVKDPAAPKRPISAFLLFSKAKRDMIKRDGRYRTATDISTILSKMWKEATAEERQMYAKRDLEDRNRYKRELQEYQLIASEGRHEREAIAAKAVEDDDSRSASLMQAEGKQLSRAEVDEWIPSNHEPSKPEQVVEETSPLGLDFPDQPWTNDVKQCHDDDSSHHRQEFMTNCSPDMSPLVDLVEERDEYMGTEMLADFTNSMDDHESGTTGQRFDHPADPVDWDPLPLDQFERSSCDFDDNDDDFVVSPISTRYTMDDGCCTPVITPPNLSVAPKVLMDTTRPGTTHHYHRPPFGYYPFRQHPMRDRPYNRPYHGGYSAPHGYPISYHPYQNADRYPPQPLPSTSKNDAKEQQKKFSYH